jgi:hypothetical protein
MQLITIKLGGHFSDGFPALGAFDGTPMSYELPAKKRLVIESVAALASAPKGQSFGLSVVVVNKASGNTEVTHPLPLQFQASYNPFPGSPGWVVRDWWSMNHMLKAYIPINRRLVLDGWRGQSSSGVGGVEVAITGYLEDVALIKIPWPLFPAG